MQDGRFPRGRTKRGDLSSSNEQGGAHPPVEGATIERLRLKLRSESAAEAAVLRVAEVLGVPVAGNEETLSALALVRSGADLEGVARDLSWGTFEDFCAKAMSAAGYSTQRNVLLRRPRRQIDIIAESPSLVLSVDCKHWGRVVGMAGLERLALAQLERTRQYKARLDAVEKAHLPVLLTLLDNQVQIVAEGIPVVPLFSLRGFLTAVSSFDDRLLFV